MRAKIGGKFLLRIEDTDLQRSTEESTRSIIEGLEWLGSGLRRRDSFSVRQRDKHRAARYSWLMKGKAYRDFTPKEQRDDANVKQGIADRARAHAAEGIDHRSNPFRDLAKRGIRRARRCGEPFAVRLKVAREGKTAVSPTSSTVHRSATIRRLKIWCCCVRTGIRFTTSRWCIDDIEMGITHVIRGQDHLTNTHKQILLYQALGAPVPQFAHLPLILAPNKGKLSKRKHGEVVSLTTYRDRGFVPAAFRNFLALLGWSPAENGKEILHVERLIQKNFRSNAFTARHAVFNFQENDPRHWTDDKALWMNAEYIRTMPLG